MGKRVFAFILACLLCLQVVSVSTLAVEDAGSPKHIPRVVSVVFDNSGSMFENTDRWAYTSYAMQAFAAMMGSEDVLYVTYLNGPAGTVKVDLSGSGKHTSVADFGKIIFGGGTPNKVQNGADCLIREYGQHKDNAKYYLVVMADGELNSGEGILADHIATVTASTKLALPDADFNTIYFSMKSGDNAQIAGATSYFASSSDQIVNTLKNVSAEIMGRTAVNHKVSGNQLSFDLKYPALSIAIFAQKQNGDFSGFRASVQLGGKNLACQVGNYSIQCPTEIIKNQSYTEVKPTNPPAGVVSLLTNNGNPLAKGSYTVDLSGYDLQSGDVVVLVEPAVRIGCQYFLNDDDNAITFEELKSRVAEGDTVKVVCGLYEMNPDGSAGEAIPLDVLSPDYKILINGKQVGTSVSGAEHTYSFQMDKSYANGQMNVEARLAGYQPFVLRETFGELNFHIELAPGADAENEIALTKPLWKKWSAGQEGISFQLKKLDNLALERIAISVEGCDGLPSGVCSALGKAVRVEGSTVVYLPTSELEFAQLPDSFQVSLVDLETTQKLLTKTVKVVRPAYRFDIENPLADTTLSLDVLKGNTGAIRFTLMVDYDGKGQYIPVSTSDCEGEIALTPETGILPGTPAQETGVFAFTPHYDPAVDTQLSVGDLVGKRHSLSVSAQVDGQTVQSDTVTLSFSSASYRLEAVNEITAPLSLDSIKTNQQKVIFKLLADYTGSGVYGDLASWDSAALEQLSIDAAALPGKLETVYDAGGNPVGKAFIPQYDEYNSEIPFTAVAGVTHTVTATVAGTDLQATATVEVLSPDYEIVVYRENIVVTDVELIHNTEGVGFTVLRDGRVLNQQELESMTSYVLGFDKDQPWIHIGTRVEVEPDGKAHLICMPQYGGWDFPAWWFWNWLCLFNVQKGDMHMTITLGEDTAVAALSVQTSELAWIIFFVFVGLSLLILWMIFCACSTVRFVKGRFYRVLFSLNENRKYSITAVTRINPNKKTLKARIKRMLHPRNFLNLFVPFKRQKFTLTIDTKPASFIARKPLTKKMFYRTFPESIYEKNKEMHVAILTMDQCAAVMDEDTDVEFRPEKMAGKKHAPSNEVMNGGLFLTENGESIVLFLSRKEQRDLNGFRKNRK